MLKWMKTIKFFLQWHFLTKLDNSLEIYFIHLESCFKDSWSQYSATQQILVRKKDKRHQKSDTSITKNIHIDGVILYPQIHEKANIFIKEQL